MFSEVIAPICMAILFVIAYMFVKSFSQPRVNGLLRILIIAFGPIVFNLVVLVTLFFTSLIFGPALSSCCNRFASVMAAIAHLLSVVGLVGFFEFLWCKSLALSRRSLF